MLYKWILTVLLSVIFTQAASAKPVITVGSKRFTENYILAEILSQVIENQGYQVERKLGLAGTVIAFDALKQGEIDLYPEYTGTLSEAIYKTSDGSFEGLNQRLNEDQLEILPPFGFDNSYAIVMKKSKVGELGIQSLSDLSQHPELLGGLSAEFQKRKDGWGKLKEMYGIKNDVRSIEIPLTYQAVKNEKVDFAEAYTTEPLIKKNGLIILKDDKEFFPKYQATALIRKDLPKDIKTTIEDLKSKITNAEMMSLNERATNGEAFATIAYTFLIQKGFDLKNKPPNASSQRWKKMAQRTRQHLTLTFLAVFFATLIAIPLATLILDRPKTANLVLNIANLFQTIPSIALLTFMIPIFGIGFTPALIGLLVYSLLPILRNTYTALNGINPNLILSARGLGLYPKEIFFQIKLPLSFPLILAGIRTATIINIGTATLAAFIGAGGLGEPIMTGLALNDTSIILEGALPASALAIVIDFLFGLLEKRFSRQL